MTEEEIETAAKAISVYGSLRLDGMKVKYPPIVKWVGEWLNPELEYPSLREDAKRIMAKVEELKKEG